MHCISCAKNFEIKMCLNQTMFKSVEVTSLPKDKCFFRFLEHLAGWHLGRCFNYKIEKKLPDLTVHAKMANSSERGCIHWACVSFKLSVPSSN